MAGSSYWIPDLGGATPTSAADKKKRLPSLSTPKAESSKPDGASRFRELTAFAPSQEYVFQNSQPSEPVVLKAVTESSSPAYRPGLRAMGGERTASDWGTWQAPEKDEARTGPESPNPMSAPKGHRTEEAEELAAQLDSVVPQGPVKQQAPRRAKRLTWEEFNAMKPHEQAAVQFNTELIRAREKDLKANYEANSTQRKNYESLVEEIFGEDSARGAAYAPETVALLSELGYKAREGEALDDFLSLKAAVSAKEMKNFAPGKLETTIFNSNNRSVTGGASEHALANRTAELQATMAKSGQVLQNFTAAMKAKINTGVSMLGGEENKITAARGYDGERKTQAGADLDDLFKQGYSALLRTDVDAGQIWAELNGQLNEKQQEQFVRYLDSRSRQEVATGVDWNKDEIPLPKNLGPSNAFSEKNQIKFRLPAEMRKLLGLDKREG